MWPRSFLAPAAATCSGVASSSSEASLGTAAGQLSDKQLQRDKEVADALNERFQKGVIVKLLATRPGGWVAKHSVRTRF